MTHYTRCLADQLRPYDITVNCIAPGDTRTGRFMGTRAVDQARMVETGTLDRIATVDEVARVVEVFAGPLGRVRLRPGAAGRWRRAVLAGVRPSRFRQFGPVHRIAGNTAKRLKKARKYELFAHIPASKGCPAGPPALPIAHEIP